MPIGRSKVLLLSLFLLVRPLGAQDGPVSASLSIASKQLPKASLWEPYLFRMGASGGLEPYHWHVIAGSLPRRFSLSEHGELAGTLDDVEQSEFTVRIADSSNPAKQQKQDLVLATEPPLSAYWDHKATVNGQRIDGSIKVSNRTGRDFDLTFVTLAVNDIGRATAIGYQHFPLKRDTRDMEIPFGETLSPGNYVVNVDVIGEEPVSRRIFRARLVSNKESITQGP
jgi:hypothetical protein